MFYILLAVGMLIVSTKIYEFYPLLCGAGAGICFGIGVTLMVFSKPDKVIGNLVRLENPDAGREEYEPDYYFVLRFEETPRHIHDKDYIYLQVVDESRK